MTTDLKDIFKKAKAELQTRGRITGDLLDENGKCCLLGAIGLAVGVDEEDLLGGSYTPFNEGGKAYEAARALIGAIPLEAMTWMGYSEEGVERADYSAVYGFNDSYTSTDLGRADEMVYELLDRASA